jgi:hypothetical protein
VAEVIESLLSKGKDPNSNSHTSKKKKKVRDLGLQVDKKRLCKYFCARIRV